MSSTSAHAPLSQTLLGASQMITSINTASQVISTLHDRLRAVESFRVACRDTLARQGPYRDADYGLEQLERSKFRFQDALNTALDTRKILVDMLKTSIEQSADSWREILSEDDIEDMNTVGFTEASRERRFEHMQETVAHQTQILQRVRKELMDLECLEDQEAAEDRGPVVEKRWAEKCA
ncbi:hypothetical protein MKZ38_009741 [Zalerion maritima]|uniref:Uncharacterized protein n=1 Tax=Zalerion maritima TaxID=339359 RepID=A0AAD5WSV0_9PEZI|nr:hypothetical protein MKZ38_009741 [Zalerion maritima]